MHTERTLQSLEKIRDKKTLWQDAFVQQFMPLTMLCIFLIVLFSAFCKAHAEENVVRIGKIICAFPEKIGQGDVFLLKVKGVGGEKISSVKGEFLNRRLHFFKTSEGEYRSLIFTCLFDEPGTAALNLEIMQEGKVYHIRERVEVIEKDFGTERLRLPPSKVTLSKKAILQVRKDKRALDKIWQKITPTRYWRGSFMLPTKGRIGSPFGIRRIINEKPRSPHTGVDIIAPHGAKVFASNHGEVVFIGDLFFSGKSLVIDHGMGLYTMYFHLSKILVKVGEKVRKGQVVGLVGSTGRAMGSHLHFGARLQQATVNPHSLFLLPKE
jgi:hypothetical protein